jgi:AraC-like DNA-binding protein
MDWKLKNMDNSFLWFNKLAGWIDQHPLPPIPFVDFTNSQRVYNPPAEHLEISFIMEGQYGDLKIGTKQVSLSAGEVSLHNVHFGNYSEKAGNHPGWCVFLDIQGLREFSRMKRSPFFVSMPVVNQKRLALAFETLADRCRLPGMIHPGYLSGTYAYDPNDKRHCNPSRQLYIKSALLELFAILLENAQTLENNQPSEQLQIIRLAIEFIARNYPRPHLALSDIAEAVYLSEDYFGLIFRQQVGTTPMRYLKTVRIEQSKLLLAKTQLSIGEIAARVGFEDPLHFSRVFHEHAGRSPRQHRKKANNNPLTSK